MVSILVPSFNQVQFLPDALDSALEQTCQKEIIVIDDGSTDGSLDIAKKYEKFYAGIRVISQVNKGLASARNTGIMNAKGKYILPLDADDYLDKHCGATLLEKMKKSRADVVAGSFKCFGLSNEEVVLMPEPKIEDFKVGNRVGYCALFKKDVLLEVGGYSPKMTWGFEDYHLWFNLLTRGKKIITLKDVLWYYRIKENSMIHEANAHKEELMAQIYKDFPQLHA